MTLALAGVASLLVQMTVGHALPHVLHATYLARGPAALATLGLTRTAPRTKMEGSQGHSWRQEPSGGKRAI